MLTLLGSLLGFLSSAVPDIFKFFQDKKDKKHELEMIQIRQNFELEAKKAEISGKVEISNNDALIEEIKRLAEAQKPIGISWVDALNSMVRPTLALGYFALYVAVKIMLYYQDMGWQIWTEEDSALFAGVISYYFGARGLRKLNGK